MRFGTPTPGDRTVGEMAANKNVFALGGGGRQQTNEDYRERLASAPPQVITQQWSAPNEGDDGPWGDQQNTVRRPNMKAKTYSGMATAT